ncbi:hypothetical protein [Paraburkholderia xenovorans]
MKWIKPVWNELIGLFVDDGSLALAVIVWVVVAALLLPRIGIADSLRGAILFVGFGGILAESVVRRARR